MRHRLKTHPGPFQAVWDGRKNAEFRRNDRDFREGDWLLLLEWEPNTEEYTGRQVEAVVSHLQGPSYGIPEGYVMLSLDRDRWKRRIGGITTIA